MEDLIAIKVKHTKGTFDFQTDLNAGLGITGVFGPSGAGKTTLLRVTGGLERPSRGIVRLNKQVLFDSENHVNMPPHRRKIGYVFQEDRLFPHLTVKQNLLFGWNRKTARVNVDEVSGLLDLSPFMDKKPSKLSGGQRQRVALGRALLTSPDLLLLDEPFSNLDYPIRHEIIRFLLRLHRQLHIPMLVVSHELPDILRLTQNLVLIENGKIVAHGNYYQMISDGPPGNLMASQQVNIFDLALPAGPADGLFRLAVPGGEDAILLSHVPNRHRAGDTIRLSLRPDDIALAKRPIPDISIQNQLRGTIKRLIVKTDRAYCLVDCGIPLLAEITPASISSLNLREGEKIVCLFKSRAIQTVYY